MGVIVIKIVRLAFLLFLICFAETFSQETKALTFFPNDFSWIAEKNYPSILYNRDNLSVLHNMSTTPYFASVKTQSAKAFPFNNNSVNHHPLVFAKINFFGIENLEQHDDIETSIKEKENSFWDNEIVYFVVGAVAATALYIVWQNSGSENPPQKTFGLPPKPQGADGL